MRRSKERRRNSRRGMALLAVLGLAIALSIIAGLVQMRAVAQTRLAASLTAQIRADLAKDALYDRLRGLVADQMTAVSHRGDRPALDGAPFVMEQDGRLWQVEVQDVEALVNPYNSAPELVAVLVPDAAQMLSRRTLLAQEGTRFPALSMAMARLGLPAELGPILTDKSTQAKLRQSTLSETLATLLPSLPPHLVMGGQVQTVRITLRPAEQSLRRP